MLKPTNLKVMDDSERGNAVQNTADAETIKAARDAAVEEKTSAAVINALKADVSRLTRQVIEGPKEDLKKLEDTIQRHAGSLNEKLAMNIAAW